MFKKNGGLDLANPSFLSFLEFFQNDGAATIIESRRYEPHVILPIN